MGKDKKKAKGQSADDIELLVERAMEEEENNTNEETSPSASSVHESEADLSDEAPDEENTDECEENRRALKAIRNLTADEDEPENTHTPLTLASILGGDILGGGWFRRQFFFIVMCVAMILVYVSNRYICQQEMIESKVLSDTLLDRRYKALTRSAQLKEKMRRSYIEESLTDSTLQTANTPSFNLKVEQ